MYRRYRKGFVGDCASRSFKVVFTSFLSINIYVILEIVISTLCEEHNCSPKKFQKFEYNRVVIT